MTGDAMTSDVKTCPYCAETIKAAAIKCRYCGSSLAAPPASPRVAGPIASAPRPTAVPAAPPPAPILPLAPEIRPRAHVQQITFMWILVVLSAMFSFSEPVPSLVGGLVSLGLAIYLVCQRATADKVNGWIVIGLNILGFIIALAQAGGSQNVGM